MKFPILHVVSLAPVLLGCSCATSNSVINLSHYDERHPQFAAMVEQGMIGAIHEATYPPLQVDTAYGERQDEAVRAGLSWGAYHFGDGTNPIRQADHFLDVVESKWRQSAASLPRHGVLLVLDFERNDHYPGGDMRVDQAAAFVQRVHERTGLYPGLYASENRIKKILAGPNVDPASKSVLEHCWLWIANYHHTPESTSPWGHWDLWQYTGDGVCDLPRSSYPIAAGNIRAAERNIFHGSAGSLRGFWEKHAWQPSI
jgi:lysozyme